MKVSVAALAVLLIAICYQTSAAPGKSWLSKPPHMGTRETLLLGQDPSCQPSYHGSVP